MIRTPDTNIVHPAVPQTVKPCHMLHDQPVRNEMAATPRVMRMRIPQRDHRLLRIRTLTNHDPPCGSSRTRHPRMTMHQHRPVTIRRPIQHVHNLLISRPLRTPRHITKSPNNMIRMTPHHLPTRRTHRHNMIKPQSHLSSLTNITNNRNSQNSHVNTIAHPTTKHNPQYRKPLIHSHP